MRQARCFNRQCRDLCDTLPCLPCTKAILQAGVKKIHYLNDYRNNQYALDLIQQVGATVHQVELDPAYFEKLSFGALNGATHTNMP